MFFYVVGVRERAINNDSAFLEAVKNVVLLRRDSQKPANEPAQSSSVKTIFNYLTNSTPHHSSDEANNMEDVD
jgi:hypothetical protein